MKSFHLFDSKDIKRLVFIACFIFFLFGLIVTQFYNLQILQGNKWDKIASAQHKIDVTEYFRRGGFYSNTELNKQHHQERVPFVLEVHYFHLYIDPYSIKDKYKISIAKKILEYFKFSSLEKEKLFSEFFKKSRSRRIISWVDKDTKNEILKWWKEFSKKEKIVCNAIFFVGDYKRCYPFGSLLGQVLHTVQEQKDPLSFQAIPTGGLELYFNDYLKGRLGRRIITRSLRHPLDTGEVIDKPENGCDIYLTINHYLQAIAEEELEKGIKNANAQGGSAIMMDPYTGEILALAQKPSFDIRDYKKYFNDEKLKDRTRVKALLDPFEPGSIMKPITLAIALKANTVLRKHHREPIFSVDEKISTENGYFPGRDKPFNERSHFLNAYLAIQKSSNIYFANIIDRLINTLGEEWYKAALVELFGFSKKTGIEIPGEEVGLVPQIGKYYKNKIPQWSKATPYSLAIGYNILVNAMQIVKAYSIIANGGKEVNPTILKKIIKNIDGKDQIIVDNTKNFEFRNKKQIIDPKDCQIIKQAMKFTTKLGGTSRLADIYGYTEAGKSGTAEKNIQGKYKKDVHISSFIGFVPVEQPRFILMIIIDEPEKKYIPGLGPLQQGGICAAPVFKEISTRALKYLGVAPDDPFGYPYLDPRRDINKADWYPEVKYLSELYKYWNN